jgi:hypothetical protein
MSGYWTFCPPGRFLDCLNEAILLGSELSNFTCVTRGTLARLLNLYDCLTSRIPEPREHYPPIE